MSIKACVFDVDGTMTNENTFKLVPSVIEACNQLQQKGIKVIIGTGRSPHSIPAIKGKIFPDYYVGANGSQLADKDGKIIYYSVIEKETFDEINDYCRKNDIGLFWKFMDGTYIYSEKGWDHFFDDAQVFIHGDHPNVNALPTAGAVNGTKEMATKLIERFEGKVSIVDGGFTIFDIDCLGVNKGTGLTTLLDMIGIDPSECMAFGDSENDLEMLKVAGVAVAMGNGYDSVKAIADYVTDKASEDGVMKALKKYKIL